MSILLQLMFLAVFLAAMYAVLVHNREKIKETMSILPDFTKLIPPVRHEFAQSACVKVVVFVPDSHSEAVRHAMAGAGGGIIGHYTACSFSSLGMGRYVPGHGARPFKGTIGSLEVAEEERIEMTVSREKLAGVVAAIKKASPYEETIIDIYPLEAIPVAEGEHGVVHHH